MLIHLRAGLRLVHSFDVAGPVEVGRQCPGEAAPFARGETADGQRIVIAGLDETTISRRHARIVPLSPQRVRIENVSGLSPLICNEVHSIAPGAVLETELPLWLTLSDRHLQVESGESDSAQLASLAGVTLAPRLSPATNMSDAAFAPEAAGWRPSFDALPWLRAVLEVLQSASTTDEFYALASDAIVKLAGFDAALVLLPEGDEWHVMASAAADDDQPMRPFSRHVVRRAETEKRTLWQDGPGLENASHSLANVAAVIATPILDQHGNVIALVYADRVRQVGQATRRKIDPAEAALVELLSGSVAAGLARLEQRRQAMAARVQFEQFFTPQLARQLERDPSLLDGRAAEISVLFADIRRFSAISERLGPERTFAWIRDAMTEFSECVMRHDGVLLDYVGDELIAMWGAPQPQRDHAELTCRAAKDMLATQVAVSQRWAALAGEPTELGIGICSGPAHVGNIGSARKFKYGPLGNTVNLASRIQGLTRKTGASLLVSAATFQQLASPSPARRIAKVRVANIDQPLDIYELGTGWSAGDPRDTCYRSALDAYEAARFDDAARQVEELLQQAPHDGPGRLLRKRIQAAMSQPIPTFDAIWEPGSK